MDMETIQFIKKNEEKAGQLKKSIEETNFILDDFLNNMSSQSKRLQKNKKFDDVIKLVRIQQDVYELMENQSKIAENLNGGGERVGTSVAIAYPDVNYDEYIVDSSVAYDLTSDFRHKRPYGISIKDDYIKVSTWKEMLTKTAEYLNNLDPELFNTIIDDDSFKWGAKANFTTNPDELREASHIKGSNIYVETSKDSIAVRQLVRKMVDKFNIDINDYKVFLRADYTPIHENKTK